MHKFYPYYENIKLLKRGFFYVLTYYINNNVTKCKNKFAINKNSVYYCTVIRQ